MRKITVLAVAATLAGIAPSAEASSPERPCTSAPESEWLSLTVLVSKVEALGYQVRKAKLSRGCGEVYAIGKDGSRVELYVDPTNGTIVGHE